MITNDVSTFILGVLLSIKNDQNGWIKGDGSYFCHKFYKIRIYYQLPNYHLTVDGIEQGLSTIETKLIGEAYTTLHMRDYHLAKEYFEKIGTNG